MIEHIVAIKTKSGVSSESVKKMVFALRGLKGKVPAIVDISCGENFTDRNQGYNIGLVIRLKGSEDIDQYRLHPEHVAVVNEYVKPIMEGMIVLDYEA